MHTKEWSNLVLPHNINRLTQHEIKTLMHGSSKDLCQYPFGLGSTSFFYVNEEVRTLGSNPVYHRDQFCPHPPLYMLPLGDIFSVSVFILIPMIPRFTLPQNIVILSSFQG